MNTVVRLAILMLLFGFAPATAQITVVTTINPYHSLISQITGDAAEVIQLLPPGASPHTFYPTPRHVATLAEADLIVLNGGLDAWLLTLIEASETRGAVIEVLAELEFDHRSEVDDHGDEDADPEGEGEHGHGGVNPHVWLDPVLMRQAATMFAERLVEADPANAGQYRANAAALEQDLEALDRELQIILEPVRGESFVPFHDAWPYFADRYGLNLVVEIEPFPGREPSPAYLAEALRLIKESGARAVFGEVQLNSRPAEVIAESAGVPLVFLDPLGGTQELESYQAMLRFNAVRIARTLAGTQ